MRESRIFISGTKRYGISIVLTAALGFSALGSVSPSPETGHTEALPEAPMAAVLLSPPAVTPRLKESTEMPQTENEPAPVSPPETAPETPPEVSDRTDDMEVENEAPEVPADPVQTSDEPASSETAPPSIDPRTAEIQSDYNRRVLTAIARRKVYPAGARQREEEDSVKVRILIDRRGRLIESGIVESRGHRLLEEASLRAASRAAPFPAPPGDSHSYELIFYMEYRLDSRG